jgi:4-hydroxybenzoate polyprenyltransferase
MPEKIIAILDMFIMGLMTFISYILGFLSIILMASWTSILGVIPTILATLYWLPKIKRQINDYHNGSFFGWLKSFVKKN